MADLIKPVTDYETYKTKIAQTAAQTRDVGDTAVPAGAAKLASKLPGSYGEVAQTAVSQYGRQAESQKKQAEKAASALEMQGGATIDYLQNLDKIREGVTAKAGAARDAWAAAPEKADDYVQAAKQ